MGPRGWRVSERVMIAAAKSNRHVVEVLLNRLGDGITITEDVVTAAAGK